MDFYESQKRESQAVSPTPRAQAGPSARVIHFEPDTPPDLHHTRIVSAQFDGLSASNWNDLVHQAHRRAVARGLSFEALRSATQSNIASGLRKDSGFRYVPDINLSIQNVDANLAWRNALNLARRLKVPIHVEFEWRDADGAAHPGKKALVSWVPVGSDKRTGHA